MAVHAIEQYLHVRESLSGLLIVDAWVQHAGHPERFFSPPPLSHCSNKTYPSPRQRYPIDITIGAEIQGPLECKYEDQKLLTFPPRVVGIFYNDR